MQIYYSNNVNETKTIGADLFALFRLPACVYLVGDMGVGKTTLCQAIIEAAGYCGVITSPTYNLIQEYEVEAGTIYHMDLYRLEDPAEIEFLGLDDLWHRKSLFLIEWPSKGLGHLRSADLTISISLTGSEEQNSEIGERRLITLDSR